MNLDRLTRHSKWIPWDGAGGGHSRLMGISFPLRAGELSAAGACFSRSAPLPFPGLRIFRERLMTGVFPMRSCLFLLMGGMGEVACDQQRELWDWNMTASSGGFGLLGREEERMQGPGQGSAVAPIDLQFGPKRKFSFFRCW